MEKRVYDDPLYALLKPVVAAMGYEIVELSSKRIRTGLMVHLVIYCAGGVGIHECTAVSKAVCPRIEMHESCRDVRMEVSSPGIDRTLKSIDEFKIFQGRGVKIFSGSDWSYGIVCEADDTGVQLKTVNGVEQFEYDSVKKAKLDYSLEVE